jgi:hypothetical protein
MFFSVAQNISTKYINLNIGKDFPGKGRVHRGNLFILLVSAQLSGLCCSAFLPTAASLSPG